MDSYLTGLENRQRGSGPDILAMLRGTPMTTKVGYNGYANYETWNAALWIQNDYGLYVTARRCDDYAEFQELMNTTSISDIDDLGRPSTPDGVLWNDSKLDTDELDEVIAEL